MRVVFPALGTHEFDDLPLSTRNGTSLANMLDTTGSQRERQRERERERARERRERESEERERERERESEERERDLGRFAFFFKGYIFGSSKGNQRDNRSPFVLARERERELGRVVFSLPSGGITGRSHFSQPFGVVYSETKEKAEALFCFFLFWGGWPLKIDKTTFHFQKMFIFVPCGFKGSLSLERCSRSF